MGAYTGSTAIDAFIDEVKIGIDAVEKTGVETWLDKNLVLTDFMTKIRSKKPMGALGWAGDIKKATSGARFKRIVTGTEELAPAPKLTRAVTKLGINLIEGAFVMGDFQWELIEIENSPIQAAKSFVSDVIIETQKAYAYTMESYMLIGALPGEQAAVFDDVAELYGMNSLCGAVNAGGLVDGVNYGFIEFLTPTAQTSAGHLTMGLARDQAIGHYNQFKLCGASGLAETDALTSGKNLLGTIIREINRANGGISNLRFIADVDTYAYAESQQNTRVVPIVVGVPVGEDLTEWDSTVEYMKGVRIQASQVLDRTAATLAGTDAEDGLIYCLSPNRMFRLEHNGGLQAMGRALEHIDGLSTSRAMRWRHNVNFGCEDLRTLGVLCGTALTA
jgi:hypothetical protein